MYGEDSRDLTGKDQVKIEAEVINRVRGGPTETGGGWRTVSHGSVCNKLTCVPILSS